MRHQGTGSPGESVTTGKRENFLLGCLLPLQFVFDNVFDFGIRLIPRKEPAVNEHRRRPADASARAFLNISLDRSRLTAGIQTLIEGLSIHFQVDGSLFEIGNT